MKEKILEKLNYIVGMLGVAALIGLTVFLCNAEIIDFDLWLHLKTGALILQKGYVPGVDILSCTINGQPWSNHEWLFQIIIHLVRQSFGFDGLITLQACVIAFMLMLLLFLGDIRDRQLGTISLLLLVVLACSFRFTIRPDIFSLLFFTAFLYFLISHLKKKWVIFLLFVIQVLWVNMHGFFIFGPFLVGIGLISEFLKRKGKLPWEWNTIGRLEDEEYSNLKIIFAATILASLVNPQFVVGALYPFKVLFQMSSDSSIFFNHIAELQRPLSLQTIFTAKYIHYKALILISIYGFVANRKRIDICELLLWVFFLALSFLAVRNVIYFAIIAYIVIMANFVSLGLANILPVTFKSKTIKQLTFLFLKFLLIAWMVRYGYKLSERFYYDFEKYEPKSRYGGVNLYTFPRKAADFLVENNIQGNFLNHFNSGAYLVGRTSPKIKVYIDGRTEVYGPDFFKNYLKIWIEMTDDVIQEAIDRYHLTGAFFNAMHHRIPEEILKYFYTNKEWVLVYLDYDGVIFLKDVPLNKKVIDEYRLDKESLSFEQTNLEKVGPKRVDPLREIKRGFTLLDLGLFDEALAQAEEAILLAPGYSEPYYLRGRFFWEKGQYKEAFENFRIATMIVGNDTEYRYYLAQAYEKVWNLKEAIKNYEMMTKRKVQEPKVYFALARAHAENNETQKALKTLSQALSFPRAKAKEALKTGDTFKDNKEYAAALKAYDMILGKDPRLADAYYKIGLCFEAMGKSEKAKEAFRRGLRIEPVNSELQKALD